MAEIAPGTMTTSHPFGTCPACGTPIVAHVTVEVTPDDRAALDGYVSLAGKMTGLRVEHNCIPAVMR